MTATSPAKLTWLRFAHNKAALLGLSFLIILTVLSILAPWLTPYQHDKVIFDHSGPHAVTKQSHSPSASNWLGTDARGYDVLTRMLFAGRRALLISLVVVSIQLVLGTFLGTVAGAMGGFVDSLIMRICDAVLCFPLLALIMAVIALIGSSIYHIMIAVGLICWPGTCRIVRAELLRIRTYEYVEAAQALGLRPLRTMFRHMLPNAMGPLMVNLTLAVSTVVLLESAIAYLGIGINPTTASWGAMLSQAQNLSVLINYWWIWMPPGLAIALTILSVNMVGDGLRDATDTKLELT